MPMQPMKKRTWLYEKNLCRCIDCLWSCSRLRNWHDISGDVALPKWLKKQPAGRIDASLEDTSVVAAALQKAWIPAR
jgi:hypothetical protein